MLHNVAIAQLVLYAVSQHYFEKHEPRQINKLKKRSIVTYAGVALILAFWMLLIEFVQERQYEQAFKSLQ
jgi:hypothetical protein